jgi:competence protein ComEC
VRVPASLVAVPLLAGCVAGLLLSDRHDPGLPLCAAAASLLALLAGIVYAAEGRAGEATAAIVAGCLTAGVSLGVADARAAYDSTLAAWFAARSDGARDDPVRIEGVLESDAAVTGNGTAIMLAVSRVQGLDERHPAAVRGGVRLSVSGLPAADRLREWRAGRTIRAAALLRQPTGYRDPGLPNEVRAMARRGIVLVGTVKSASLVEVLAPAGAVDEAAGRVRAWTRRQLARHVGRWGGPSSGIATAILIGDRTGLSEEDERRLQQAGTYHVIAISGGNIAILTALLLGAARLLRTPPRLSSAAVILALLFYDAVAGGGASVTRAVTAAVIYLAARLFDHRGPAMNALCVAAAGALAGSALTAFDAGFILSFGATLGILLGAPRLLRRDRPATIPARVAAAATALLAATACAEAALAPASAVIFSRITFAGLLLNFAAIPLMVVVQGAALVTLALALVSESVARLAPFSEPIAAWTGYAAHVAAAWLVQSARLVDLAPWLSRDVPPPAWWLVLAYYISLAGALVLPRHPFQVGRAELQLRHQALCGTFVCLALMIAAPRFASSVAVPPRPPGSTRLVFFDVGQGDSTIVLFPNGRALLVDAGGAASASFDVGARVVAPALRALGVRALESLVITHADPDHVGGAASIVRAFTPRSIWEGVPVPRDAARGELAALALRQPASWRTLQAGDVQREGDVEIRVLHPPPPDWERQRVRNDDSVVLEIRTGDVSVVLPGDIERAAEHAVLPRLALAPLVVLKAPHHGSATSSTPPFVAAVRPGAVIFSAGQNNRFGHPAAAVVARYAAAGVEMFDTARDGAVFLDTDGKSVEIRGWASGRVWRVGR